MAMDDRLPLKARKRDQITVIFEEFTEQEGLAREPVGAFVAGEKVAEFIPEDGDAAGLKPDDGHARLDFRGQSVENLQKQVLRSVEHAEVVERPPAAQIALR